MREFRYTRISPVKYIHNNISLTATSSSLGEKRKDANVVKGNMQIKNATTITPVVCVTAFSRLKAVWITTLFFESTIILSFLP